MHRKSRLIKGSSDVCRKSDPWEEGLALCLASMPPNMKSHSNRENSILNSLVSTHLNQRMRDNSGVICWLMRWVYNLLSTFFRKSWYILLHFFIITDYILSPINKRVPCFFLVHMPSQVWICFSFPPHPCWTSTRTTSLCLCCHSTPWTKKPYYSINLTISYLSTVISLVSV